MSKRTLILGTALLILAMLSGCKYLVRTDIDFDGDALSKAQKIVVSDAAGNEKAVLTEKEDIESLVDAMTVEVWRFAELPEDLAEAGSLTLWQEETITALFGGETRENEICTLRVYANGDYLTIETGLADVSFSISGETAEYLRGLTA